MENKTIRRLFYYISLERIEMSKCFEMDERYNDKKVFDEKAIKIDFNAMMIWHDKNISNDVKITELNRLADELDELFCSFD